MDRTPSNELTAFLKKEKEWLDYKEVLEDPQLSRTVRSTADGQVVARLRGTEYALDSSGRYMKPRDDS